LGNLRRLGRAVTAIVITWADYDFDEAAGRLAAEGIPARWLKDREALPALCRDYVLRP
jgi:hypothetical protein